MTYAETVRGRRPPKGTTPKGSTGQGPSADVDQNQQRGNHATIEATPRLARPRLPLNPKACPPRLPGAVTLVATAQAPEAEPPPRRSSTTIAPDASSSVSAWPALSSVSSPLSQPSHSSSSPSHTARSPEPWTADQRRQAASASKSGRPNVAAGTHVRPRPDRQPSIRLRHRGVRIVIDGPRGSVTGTRRLPRRGPPPARTVRTTRLRSVSRQHLHRRLHLIHRRTPPCSPYLHQVRAQHRRGYIVGHQRRDDRHRDVVRLLRLRHVGIQAHQRRRPTVGRRNRRRLGHGSRVDCFRLRLMACLQCLGHSIRRFASHTRRLPIITRHNP
jgi:hypothetical protein